MVSYWGNTVAPCLQCQNGRRTLLSWRACFYADEIYARPWTDVRTDRVPLSLCFNSLITIFPLVPSLSVFSLHRPPHRLFFPRSLIRAPSLSPYCFCIFAFPLSVLFLLDNSASHLVFLSSIPRLLFSSFFFSIFRISFFSAFAFVSQWLYCLCLSRPIVPHILLVWNAIIPPLHSSPFVDRSFMVHCYQLTPTLVLPLTFQRCSRRLLLFLPSAVECRGRGRERETTDENNTNETKTKTNGGSSIFDPYPFPSIELKKCGNARKHKFSRQSLIRKRNPCHRSHWSHVGVPAQRTEK